METPNKDEVLAEAFDAQDTLTDLLQLAIKGVDIREHEPQEAITQSYANMHKIDAALGRTSPKWGTA
jgi:hypothetical protein